ncbi:SigE family RNA polymerase sigma factor [Nucisporomicrobium flavum]|jgi:RNA polymerase sigma-70 factor (sigma-E family)|uniref:SigE family RNA polymerase sigma factor n=1 Tax=Nucisporomicrobium flavum TaxID=2785915 RepID=UPI003C2F6DA6
MRADEEREYTEYVAGRLSRLHRTAYMLCGDAHRADDIVQATLTALYVQWRKVSAAHNVDAYVQSILVRRYLDERRLRWSRVRLGGVPAHAVPIDAAEHGIVERDALLTALRALPKGQRAVVVLRYFDDLTVEATAEVLKCSVGNVKSQCSRGLAALRAALTPAEAGTARGSRDGS